MKRLLASLVVIALFLLMGLTASQASPGARRSSQRELTSAEEGGGEEEQQEGEHILARAEQASITRTAPGTHVSAAAFRAARAAASQLPVVGGSWSELTDVPYQNDDPRYRDPVASNSGAGWFLVTGRISALTTSGGAIYAGGADGGVWRSTDDGGSWTELSAGLPRLSVGSLATNPSDGSVWVGLGEANTAFENFEAEGVYRLGRGSTTWSRVGGDELLSNTIYRVFFDGAGHVYAATNRGLYRRVLGDLGAPWTLVLKPDPNPTRSPYRTSHITDVTVQPGTQGRTVLAVLGWRGGTLPADTSYNGFYVSTAGGTRGTFARITPRGDIDVADIGRTTFARATDDPALYAVMESPGRLSEPDELEGFTVLQGVYVSENGNPAGPWRLIADATELANSGSAEPPLGIFPGVQAWYNQYIDVDPSDPDHVYLGLEEVHETRDGGETWTTPGPYWNFTLPCYDGGLRDCPPTTHPDQHAMTFAGSRFYAGGDGGVWHRPITKPGVAGWVDTNRTLHTLQYYYAGVGEVRGGDAIWGGLQDNGVSLLKPTERTMVSPFGGDGGDTLVDPRNGNRAVVEYVNLDISLTTNGGQSFREISPSCEAFTYTPDPCDPTPRFIAPFRADVKDITHWVAGGQYVWEDHAGWGTRCSAEACDWKIVHDTGEAHSITALALNGATIYAAWCFPGPSCNPGTGVPFDSGIDTNYGGEWHRINAPRLPNRYVNQVTVDPAAPAHVYAVYGAFSRRWIPSAGVGHVFESTDGGATWTNISGNLPDIPADDLVLWRGKLALATDAGIYISDRDRPAQWSRLGDNFPNVATWDLTLSPDKSYLVAATHGRGLWRIPQQ